MKKFKIKTYVGIFTLLVILFSTFSANSQSTDKLLQSNKIETAQTAVEKLRELYQNRDYESGYEIGQKLTAQFPENIELQSWFIVNMARNEMSKEAVEAAEQLVENNKENAWAQFAAANSYIRNLQKEEAASASRKALELKPDDEEFILLFGSSLLMQRKYDEIYDLLDKNSSKITDKSRLLVMKAEAQYRQAVDGEKDEGKRKVSFKNFAKAQEISPNSVNANYVYGVYLIYDNRYAEAYPPLKKAAALSPEVAHIRRDFWKTILNGQPTKSEERKKSEVIADINSFIKLRPDSVKNLEIISGFCNDFNLPDKKQEIDALILKQFPQSAQAERILIRHIRRFDYIGEDKKIDEKKRAQLIQILRDFINRPNHFNNDYFSEAYDNLFFHIKENKNISDAELLQIAEEINDSQQFAPDKIYSMIVAAFIDRKMFREGEKFVNFGFEKVKRESEAQRDFIKDEEQIKQNLDEMNADLHSVSGWLLFKEGSLDEAEKELETAVKLYNQDLVAFNRLGQIYEAKNRLNEAEDAYIKGFASYPSANELNRKSIENLYEKRNGNSENYEKYFEKVKIVERETRKNRIISAKIKDAKNITPFTLKNLDAKTISSADLSSKVIVINIWALWCAPCVREMPELQELYKKYAGDKDVAILTINDNDDLAKLKKFMTDKKFDFPVLRDEKYLEDVGINAFPTTWFV
ncbi:MAG: redoxin domain-containing protein, partial [Acidobacteriota bacterium]